jgi:hypothetical protein
MAQQGFRLAALCAAQFIGKFILNKLIKMLNKSFCGSLLVTFSGQKRKVLSTNIFTILAVKIQ